MSKSATRDDPVDWPRIKRFGARLSEVILTPILIIIAAPITIPVVLVGCVVIYFKNMWDETK